MQGPDSTLLYDPGQTDLALLPELKEWIGQTNDRSVKGILRNISPVKQTVSIWDTDLPAGDKEILRKCRTK